MDTLVAQLAFKITIPITILKKLDSSECFGLNGAFVQILSPGIELPCTKCKFGRTHRGKGLSRGVLMRTTESGTNAMD